MLFLSTGLSTFSFLHYLELEAREREMWTVMLQQEFKVIIVDVLEGSQGIWEIAPISAQ